MKSDSVSNEHSEASKGNILLVDDDPASIVIMYRILREVANLRYATSGADALRQVAELAPDLILLDAEMPGSSGFDVLKLLKESEATSAIPIILVTSHTEPEFEITGFDLGAADYISKPVNPPRLLARVKTQLRIKNLADELRHIATVDPLTGLPNRRHFDESLAREWKNARRMGEPLSLLMIDVDHFKLFNDAYGHPAGDACLQAIAGALAAACARPSDEVARIGGEEFVMLMPNTPRGGSRHIAEMVLNEISRLGIAHKRSPTSPHCTVSVGAACYDIDSASWIGPSVDSRFGDVSVPRSTAGDLMVAADQALYVAKNAGRAQAWMLDVADVGRAELAELTSSPRQPG